MSMFNIKKINNGILIGSNTGENRKYEEQAFLNDDPDFETKVDAYLDEKALPVSEYIVQNAKREINKIVNPKEEENEAES